MKQYTDSQYDDDLTIGTDEYDDSFQTGDIDLFEFGGDEDSTISKLKTLVLSIDWEITDEVLLQFNDEIQDLKDVWAGEKIQMVYLQALEKIGKYIFREKADSHPNSIRLLLSMYYNLERIVLSGELSGAEKKKMLLEDVHRFEKLKKLIGKEPKVVEPAEISVPVRAKVAEGEIGELLGLKAIVLGIDWEITDKDLLALREEVIRLENAFADSKPKLVLLQGIGTLGAYIRKKKSNAHADAFKLLHSFYEGLEKLIRSPFLTFEEEKEILRPEVNKFNNFRSIIADTLVKVDLEAGEPEEEEYLDYSESDSIAPAFADLPEDGIHGFQEDLEAKLIKLDMPVNVDEHINRFFGEDEAQKPAVQAVVEPPPVTSFASMEKEAELFSDAFFDTEAEQESAVSLEVDRKTALQGVDVETEADDESGEEALPVFKGEVAPALVDNNSLSALSAVEPAEKTPEGELAEELTGRLDDFFGTFEETPEPEEVLAVFEVPADVALQGVNVEAEDDEEGDEPAPPMTVAEISDIDEIAPAFAEIEEELQWPEQPFAGIEPAGIDWVEPVEEDIEEVPAALFDITEGLEESETALAEEAVAERFDDLFATLPDEEAPEPEEATVEKGVEAFFSLEEEPEEVEAVEPGAEPDVFDQEILEIDETDFLTILEAEPAELPLAEEDVVFGLAEEDILSEDLADEEFEAVFTVAEIEPLEDLRGCVQSLGLELDDAIIQGLFSEINSLRQRWVDRPLEKTFLQLMSTVGEHIDQYRYGASDESSALLASIVDDLEKSQTMPVNKAQDVLLVNTCKVLQWQQDMLSSRAVSDVAGQPVYVEAPSIEHEVSYEDETVEQVMPAEPYDASGAGFVEDESFTVDLEETLDKAFDESPVAAPVSVDNRQLGELVRTEIEALRDTLKKEIAELRKALNIDGGKR